MTQYIKPEEFHDLLDTLSNDYDRAYYMMLYEGISPFDALEMKPEDVDFERQTVKYGGKEVSASPELLKEIKAACEQKMAKRHNWLANGLIESKVHDSDKIIKFSADNPGEPPSTYEIAHSKMLAKAASYRSRKTWKPHWNESNIRKSGLVNQLEPYIKEAGGNVDSAAETFKEDFSRIIKRWDYYPTWETKKICKQFLGTD